MWYCWHPYFKKPTIVSTIFEPSKDSDVQWLNETSASWRNYRDHQLPEDMPFDRLNAAIQKVEASKLKSILFAFLMRLLGIAVFDHTYRIVRHTFFWYSEIRSHLQT
uniref:Uncharacterized protein n=1 Tax=Caenorhabditis japonica TaxID=281687 RepID=A0A8R1INS2_CAEJA